MLTCPKCGSDDIGLIEKRSDETLLVRCEVCGHQWSRGDPRPKDTEAPASPDREPLQQASDRSYLLQTDGSGTGTVANPVEGAVGVVLMDPDGNTVPGGEISKRIGPVTNTVAEYRALIAGLELAQRHGIKRIRIFVDSELVVDQINGLSKVRALHIRPWYEKALALFNQFPNRRISWVPRKWNKRADHLATKALAGR
jgi:ribonuclease HI